MGYTVENNVGDIAVREIVSEQYKSAVTVAKIIGGRVVDEEGREVWPLKKRRLMAGWVC